MCQLFSASQHSAQLHPDRHGSRLNRSDSRRNTTGGDSSHQVVQSSYAAFPNPDPFFVQGRAPSLNCSASICQRRCPDRKPCVARSLEVTHVIRRACRKLVAHPVGLYYALSPAYQRQGYATEAAQALINYAFTQLHLKRIVATTTYENVASIGVMRKLGMRIEKNPSPDPPGLQVVGILESRPAHGLQTGP
jgi:GNAT superfamily N-acetyltransferase